MIRSALLLAGRGGLCLNQKLATGFVGQNVLARRRFTSEMVADWPEAIKNFLARENINKPTPIQERTLKAAMENKDLVGVARTGSGKTLAFVIPAVIKILRNHESQVDKRREVLPSCLVLCPTRELATQTAHVFKKFTTLGIKSLVLVGGASRPMQIQELQYADQEVYIATPGRLKDLMDSELVDLSQVKYLVLDEADRMLDMGFAPQIRDILRNVPKDRQTLMWSATWPSEIRELAREFMKDFEQIKVDSDKLKANPNIKQIVKVISPKQRIRALMDYLLDITEEVEQPRVLIFTNTKRQADFLLIQLMRNKHRAVAMHGNRSQSQRDFALRQFKNKSCNILVATDVAARGLDIDDVTHVINFDFPNNIEDYIHRIGRTARGEKSGTSLSFFTEENSSLARKLIRVLRETSQPVPPELEDL